MGQLVDKIINNKFYILLLLVIALLAGSTATWLYVRQETPKKIPIRAKQVSLSLPAINDRAPLTFKNKL